MVGTNHDDEGSSSMQDVGIVWVVGCQWSRVLPQKPIITQLIKNSPSFYGKLYITVSIRGQAGHNFEVKLLKNFVNNHFHTSPLENKKEYGNVH
jgi:hypothetical protein